jgi:hypothetical protein
VLVLGVDFVSDFFYVSDEGDVAAVYRIPTAVAWVPLVEVVMSHPQPGFSNQHRRSLEVRFELLAQLGVVVEHGDDYLEAHFPKFFLLHSS